MCDMNFFAVLNSDFKTFRSKMSCLIDQNKALKDTFFQIHFTFQSLKDLKTVIFEYKMSHVREGEGGGVTVTYES